MLLASEEHSLFETGPLDLYSLSQPSPSSQKKYFVSENENILGQFPPVKHIKTGYSYYTPTFAFHILTWARNWQREQGEEKTFSPQKTPFWNFFSANLAKKKKIQNNNKTNKPTAKKPNKIIKPQKTLTKSQQQNPKSPKTTTKKAPRHESSCKKFPYILFLTPVFNINSCN